MLQNRPVPARLPCRSALALSKELGEGPQAGLPDADLLLPAHKPPRQAQVAAAAAHRQLQARFDAVVAAMQRLKQLHAQAAGTLAAGQGAAGSAAVELAPRAPPLFAGSQAAARRGDLVQELLAHGPPLTAQPDAVQPGSWGDLLAAGKGGPSGASAAAAAVMTPPLTARRLSNPAQEASNFAAEGLAADADVLTVHGVLVRRLAAAGASLQAACSSGAGPGSAEVRAALAEAAALRGERMVAHLLANPANVESTCHCQVLTIITPFSVRRNAHAERAAGAGSSLAARAARAPQHAAAAAAQPAAAQPGVRGHAGCRAGGGGS